MTLGSKLAVSARPHWLPRCRASLGSYSQPRFFSQSLLFRNNPADVNSAPDALVQPAREAAASSPSSLVDRLAQVPVRPHGPRDSVVVRLPTKVKNKRETHEELRRNHRALTQQHRLEKNRWRDLPGDWRTVLQLLLDAGPTHTNAVKEVKIFIPSESVKLLFADGPNNVYNIRSRTRCDMTLYPDTWAPPPLLGNGEEGFRSDHEGPAQDCGNDEGASIILSGQPTAVTAAVDDLLKVTKRVTVARSHDNAETLVASGQTTGTPSTGEPQQDVAPPVGPIKIRDYPDSVRRNPYLLTKRADQIPRPKEWTTETFMQYVAALVMGRPSPSAARTLYRDGGRHKDLVVQQLLAAFDDPGAAAAVSSPSLKIALTYLVRSGESLVPHAQRVFNRVTALGLPISTDVYNLMAETAVKAKNILAFQSTIRLMITRGHQPDLRTWILFLRMTEAEEVRRYIMQAMHTKNFFADVGAVISVSNEMAEHDAYRAIQLNQDLDTFLAAQRELYGPEWRLTKNAANKMLGVFGREGRFAECKQILDIMFATRRDTWPNNLTLNTVLHHCKHQNKLREAIEIVQLFDKQNHNVADFVTYHLLLEMARRKKMPHVTTVVWRYAHLVDATNYRIRNRGLALLSGGAEAEMLTRRISGFWADNATKPKCTRAGFVENLLLFDLKNRIRSFSNDHFVDPNLPPPSPAPPLPDPENPWDKILSETSSFSPSPDNPVLEERPFFPPNATPTEKYAAYEYWAARVSRVCEPLKPLGALLQLALERDEELLVLATPPSPGAPLPRLMEKNGLPVFMWPVKIHLKKRERYGNVRPVNYEVAGEVYKMVGEGGEGWERGL